MSEYGPYQPAFAPSPPAQPPSRSVLPVISLVTSLVALVGVIVLTIVLAAFGALGGGSDAPLTGQVSSAGGGALGGQVLAKDLTQVISDDGGEVSDLRYPDTASVGSGVVTICHGTISGSAWAVAVFFEDSQGRFTALPM